MRIDEAMEAVFEDHTKGARLPSWKNKFIIDVAEVHRFYVINCLGADWDLWALHAPTDGSSQAVQYAIWQPTNEEVEAKEWEVFTLSKAEYDLINPWRFL